MRCRSPHLEAALAVAATGNARSIDDPADCLLRASSKLRDLVDLRPSGSCTMPVECRVLVGTMIESHRASLPASGALAADADFFSSGTNHSRRRRSASQGTTPRDPFLPIYLSTDPGAQPLRGRSMFLASASDEPHMASAAGPPTEAGTPASVREHGGEPSKHRILRLGRTRLCGLLAASAFPMRGSRPQAAAGLTASAIGRASREASPPWCPSAARPAGAPARAEVLLLGDHGGGSRWNSPVGLGP